ncbi:MAG: hypothetical protein FJX76_18750 [Armatimonadetes bacterium]|nr:hypothetical protein [Armatimonadota bacterium]
MEYTVRLGAIREVSSPYLRTASEQPRPTASVPLDSVSLSHEEEAKPAMRVGRFAGMALLVGLSMAGAVAPAMAAEVPDPPQTTQSTTVTRERQEPARQEPARATLTTRASGDNLTGVPAPDPGTIFPKIPPSIPTLPGLPDIPLPPIPPLPTPDSSPGTPVRIKTETNDYFSVGTQSQFSRQESFTFGEIEAGREWSLDVKKGPWRSETSLDVGMRLRGGVTHDPNEPAFSGTVGATLTERMSRDVSPSTRVYGRAGLGISGGVGHQFHEEDPLNAWRFEAAIGAEYRHGATTLYGEPFFTRTGDLSGPWSNNEYGVRVGAQHRLSEVDFLQIEGKVSRYEFDNGLEQPSLGVKGGYMRRSGNVWWGPEVGYENRDGDHRATVGIRFNF